MTRLFRLSPSITTALLLVVCHSQVAASELSRLPTTVDGGPSPLEGDLTVDGTISELRQEIADLRKIVEEVANPSDAESDPDDGWELISDSPWTHKMGGRVLTEGVFWMTDPDGMQQNYFEIRQLRLELSGKGYGVLDYKVQVDFEPEINAGGFFVGSVGVKDAFVGMKDVPMLGYVRVGHYKVPFSHDQMLSRLNMTFMERNPMSDPPGFTPGRELGVASFNHADDLSSTFSFGGFVDSILEVRKDRLDDNQGFLAAGRATWLPYYDEPSDGRYLLQLGLGAIYTKTQNGSGRFAQRPEIHEGVPFIDTGAIAAEEYYVLGSEALLQWGSMYVFNELMWTSVLEDSVGNRDLYSGYVEAGYRLTGEHRRYNRQKGEFAGLSPHSNFWWVKGCRGMGAWELAARFSFVDFTDSPNQSEYQSWAFALNHYWNPKTRVQLNWINPHTKGAPFGDSSGSIFGMRLAAYF